MHVKIAFSALVLASTQIYSCGDKFFEEAYASYPELGRASERAYELYLLKQRAGQISYQTNVDELKVVNTCVIQTPSAVQVFDQKSNDETASSADAYTKLAPGPKEHQAGLLSFAGLTSFLGLKLSLVNR